MSQNIRKYKLVSADKTKSFMKGALGLWYRGTDNLWVWLRLRRDIKLFWAILVHTRQTRETSEKGNKGLDWTFQLHSFSNFPVLWKDS